MFQHIIQELITKAITQQTEKIIEKKTKKQIKKEDYDKLPDAIKTRKDTVFMTYKEV